MLHHILDFIYAVLILVGYFSICYVLDKLAKMHVEADKKTQPWKYIR